MRDAYQQLVNLLRINTCEMKVRPDLRVTAHGCDRGVEIEIGVLRENQDPDFILKAGRYKWTSAGKRNVSTMRKFAEAILNACDFVECANPEWAGQDDLS